MPSRPKSETEIQTEAGTEVTAEQVQRISLSNIYPFEGYPLKVLDEDAMAVTVECIKQFGDAPSSRILIQRTGTRLFLATSGITRWMANRPNTGVQTARRCSASLFHRAYYSKGGCQITPLLDLVRQIFPGRWTRTVAIPVVSRTASLF